MPLLAVQESSVLGAGMHCRRTPPSTKSVTLVTIELACLCDFFTAVFFLVSCDRQKTESSCPFSVAPLHDCVNSAENAVPW